MIITENKSKQVVQSHDFDSVNCTIDAEDMRYVASLLRNNYSNTRLAVVREISANAIDANLEANADRPIEIKLPTQMNPTFAVRDFGGGLSKEDVFGLYSKYGKSTKRTSNNYIGAFGIGKFAPLSYGDNFTCVSFHGGTKSSYNVFVNEEDDTKIVELHTEPSNEPNGLCIEVAVSDDDISEFHTICKNFFQFFSDDEMPKFIGVEENFIPNQEKILESKNGEWFVLQQKERNYYSRHESHVIMGRVSYPLDRHAINAKNFVDDDNKVNIVNNILSMDGFYLRVPLGSVKLHHSRESLEYNKPTQEKIVSSLLVAVEEVQEIAKEKLADSEDLWDAKRNYAKIINAMPYSLRNIFENSFEWQGIQISSPDFHRDYQLQDDLVITHSWKEADVDARNGFKVRSQKETRVICQDDYLVMFQDLESSHGNNLRVRTLFNEDENLKGVYIVHCKTSSAQNSVDHEWEFGKVDKKHVKYTSLVEKEKPQRSGVRKSNGSRANIALFKFNHKGKYLHRNADYWTNAENEIQSVDDASSIDGSYKGKLVYVAIKNYKIDHEHLELDAMKARFAKIHAQAEEDSEEKNVQLFGIRKVDTKKLDKSVWIEFQDFYKMYARDVVLANQEVCNQIFTSLSVRKDSKHYVKVQSHSDAVGKLFTNDDFKFDVKVSHPLRVAKDLWRECFDSPHKYTNVVTFLNEHDKDFLEENLFVSVNCKEFSVMLNEIKAKYPMLVHFAEHFSSWRGLGKDVLKDCNAYISLCDNGGEGN